MTDHSAQIIQSAPFRKALRSGKALVVCLTWVLALAFAAQAEDMSNDTLRLHLNVTPEGIPVIEEGVWIATGQSVFRDLGTPDGLSAWVPAALITTDPTAPATWTITESKDFMTAVASRVLANKMTITWVVELPKQGQLIRLHIRLTNRGKKPRAVDWFPSWSARWDVAGQAQWARWWQSLEFTRLQQTLTSSSKINLGSRLHSSDDAANGVNPYWVVGGQDSRIYFSLQWSGGWSASLGGLNNGFTFSAGLPSTETELVLGRGETIEGPALLVTPVVGTDEGSDRAVWMKQRYALGQTQFTSPALSFPLTYNHWYAVRAKVDDNFLNRQMAAMTPYAFDAFVVDAGWFVDGRWKPDQTKFPGKEFANMLAALKASGVKAGLWSAPQYLGTGASVATLQVEDPPFYSRFLDGYLVDMSKSTFADYLTAHVQTLREKYSIDYWKYDQPFFTEQSRAGEMKNVVGFQNALQAVRQINPDLTIENCLNGGRMINDFTLLVTQTSWLKDAGPGGLPDPQDNISVALNALQFVFPWAALRFTLNVEQLDQNNDELTRLYCRSAMAGIWGFSTDLTRISARQQTVMLQEIENYRRLNHTKFSCLYDLQLPSDTADVAGVTFYGSRRLHAGVLLYRWQRSGAFNQQVVLSKLKPSMMYHVVDVDTGTEIDANGSDLMTTGITVPFSSTRLSALVFIEPVTDAPPPQ